MNILMQPTIAELRYFFDLSIKEDMKNLGDITSNAVIIDSKTVDFNVSLREESVVCGVIASDYFLQNYSSIKYKNHLRDGDCGVAGSVIISGTGDAHEILRIERVLLNYLQHLSAVATMTHTYVSKITSTGAKICDTRKTIPGMRALQKYAVRCGGGYNHRASLEDGILIKDNHISICGSITSAVKNARLYGPHYSRIEVECDNIEQVIEAVESNVEIIMLDNMNIDDMMKAINIIGNSAVIEVSGGVNLDNVKSIAELGVDYISIGRLTHSVRAIDIGLDI